ncbi:hypothetical protein QL285_057150 [Trifolium repens]|nr:hypothetical protein QL285_057150 [Trifolium repens]
MMYSVFKSLRPVETNQNSLSFLRSKKHTPFFDQFSCTLALNLLCSVSAVSQKSIPSLSGLEMSFSNTLTQQFVHKFAFRIPKEVCSSKPGQNTVFIFVLKTIPQYWWTLYLLMSVHRTLRLLSAHRTLSPPVFTSVRSQDFTAHVRSQDFIAFCLYFCPLTGLYCLCPLTGLYRLLSLLLSVHRTLLLMSAHRTLSLSVFNYVRSQDFTRFCPYTGLYRFPSSLLLFSSRFVSSTIR